MSDKKVRIKKISGRGAGDHKMVTLDYATKWSKMLKNSGWVIEDLPEVKGGVSDVVIIKNDEPNLELPEEQLIDKDTFDEALTEKETGLTLDEQQPKEEETVDLLGVREEPITPKRRGRQPGSTNKAK